MSEKTEIEFMVKFDEIPGELKTTNSQDLIVTKAIAVTKRMEKQKLVNFMIFNKSGSIEDKPDSKYVKYVDNYFPGTIISAQILFNEDDLIEENEIK
jgi:hypothetical protein